MIAKVVSENQRDWDEHVPTVIAAYRATVHESTGFTPNYLVFGRENRMPVDIVLASVDDPKPVCTIETEYAADLIERLQQAYQKAREHLHRCAEMRKKAYDMRVKPAEFELGQWVYYLYQRRYRGRSPKWVSAYTGPYRIVHVIPPCNVVLAKNRRSKRFVVHVDKLKPFVGDPPDSWPLSTDQDERPEIVKVSNEAEPIDEQDSELEEEIAGEGIECPETKEQSDRSSDDEPAIFEDNEVVEPKRVIEHSEVRGSPAVTRPRRVAKRPVRYRD
jgi:hypothetical protein